MIKQQQVLAVLLAVMTMGCVSPHDRSQNAGGTPVSTVVPTENSVSIPRTSDAHPESPEPQRVPTEIEAEYLTVSGQWVQPYVWTEVSGALTIRFRLPAGLDSEVVEQRVALALYDISFEIDRTDPGTLVIKTKDLTHGVRFNLMSMSTKDGRRLRDQMWLFAIPAEPPELVLLDVTSGQDRSIAKLPQDVLYGSLSPDGRHALLAAAMPQTTVVYPGQVQAWLVDIQTGTLQLTALKFSFLPEWPEVIWLEGSVVVFSAGSVQVLSLQGDGIREFRSAAMHWGSISPAGNRILGWAPLGGWSLVPVTLVAYDVETLTETAYQDVVQVNALRYALPLQYEWRPDSASLILLDESVNKLIQVDLETGGKQQVTGTIAEVPQEQWLSGANGWRYRRGEWGPVTVLSPDGQVESTFGRGLVLGWKSDGKLLVVRWANGDVPKPLGSP